MGFRRRFLLLSVSLIGVSVVSADVYLASALRAELSRTARDDLAVRLRLVSRQAGAQSFAVTDTPSWDLFADELGALAGIRVTVIAPDGAVVGDSEVQISGLATLQNHRDRPEVQRALAGERGYDTRQSSTTGRGMMYLAEPLRRDGAVVAVVRAALPLTQVEHAIDELHRVLGIGSLIAIAVALLLSTGLTRLMARAMRDITEGARRMAQGDLSARIQSTSPDELGEIARALNRLAAHLSATLGDLRAERDLLGRILEAMEEGVLVAKADGTIVLMNPALRQMLRADGTDLEAPREDPTGRPVIEVVRNADLHGILQNTLTSSGPASGEIEVGLRRRRRLLVHAAPLLGEPRGSVAVFVDVTEIRRLESVRRDFVANVSHELRTPVTAVRTALETARPALREDPETADRFLEIAERNANRLVVLVRDLLDLSQIESGDLKLQIEPVDPREVAEHVLSLFQEPAERKRIRLRAEWPHTLRLARADRRALEQVLTNLVDNAVKYGAEGGQVTVRGASDDGKVYLSVEDAGPGIEPKHLPRLFERFYRVDAGRSRDRGGTGLGLSIVKHLTETMGGDVSVESVIGKGSTFTVSLPTA